MVDETEWMDLKPYSGPDKYEIDGLAAALQTFDKLTQSFKCLIDSETLQSILDAFHLPSVTDSTLQSILDAFHLPSVTDSLVHTDKIKLPVVQRNHGPRPSRTFDNRGRRRF